MSYNITAKPLFKPPVFSIQMAILYQKYLRNAVMLAHSPNCHTLSGISKSIMLLLLKENKRQKKKKNLIINLKKSLFLGGYYILEFNSICSLASNCTQYLLFKKQSLKSFIIHGTVARYLKTTTFPEVNA